MARQGVHGPAWRPGGPIRLDSCRGGAPWGPYSDRISPPGHMIAAFPQAAPDGAS
jgi:hypothetical protein